MKLTDFKVLTFDCYGTLIDWESGMIEALKPLTERAPIELTRDQILEAHGFHEHLHQRRTPGRRYSELLATVYRRMADDWGVKVSWDECETYGNSVGDWPVFPDTADALRYLAQHYTLVILSNVDQRSFARSNEKLGVEFDAVYTAEDIGSYKPADANFDYMLSMLDRRGIRRSEILHTAESLYHDLVPANRHDLSCCWIHRRHQQDGFGATREPDQMPDYDFRFESLAALVQAHAQAHSDSC